METKDTIMGLPVIKIKEYLNNSTMKKFLVIGNPIEHSLSPILHNYWIETVMVSMQFMKNKNWNDK